MSDAWWRTEHGDLHLTVRVRPNARRNEVVGAADGALKLKIAAPPVDGKANEVLRRYIGELFGARRSAIRVKLGASSRNKVVVIVGMTEPPPELRAL